MSNYFFKVLRPGINTTFQDRGRFHMQHLGVTPGGCMDQDSFSIANALVGNSLNEGVLEFAYQGPLLKLIKGRTKIAIVGDVHFKIIKSNQQIISGECYRTYILEEEEQIDITEEDLAEIVEALTVDVTPQPTGTPGGGTNNAELEELVDMATADELNEKDGALTPGVGIRVNHQVEETLCENEKLKDLNNKYENRLKNLKEQNDKYKDLLGKLKTRLEEINLVNAKLLYTNRTLSNTSLNERQKNKIADAISEVQSVEEAKVVYETLQSTVGTRHQSRAPQSLSEAVKRSSTILPRRNKNEAKPSDPVSDRWKILAGIKSKKEN